MNTHPEFAENEVLSELELKWLIQVMRGLSEKRDSLEKIMYKVIRETVVETPPPMVAGFLEHLKLVNLPEYNRMVDNIVLQMQHEVAKHDKIHISIAKKMEIYRKLVYEEA